MLFHYLVKYCQPPSSTMDKAKFLWKHPRSLYNGKKLIKMEGVSKEIVEDIAHQSQGFSGREITKMVIAADCPSNPHGKKSSIPPVKKQLLTRN